MCDRSSGSSCRKSGPTCVGKKVQNLNESSCFTNFVAEPVPVYGLFREKSCVLEAKGFQMEGQILVMSFDTTNAGLTQTLSGEITCDTECNPLHGPRVEEIIQKLEAGEDVDKQAFVDEVAFASDDTVTKVTIDGTDYDITPITQEIIDGRAY